MMAEFGTAIRKAEVTNGRGAAAGRCRSRVFLSVPRRRGDVRFTPESGRVRCKPSCLLWANSGHSTRGELIWEWSSRTPLTRP